MAYIRTVLITGGSSGIGFQIARYFARDGYRLALVAMPAAELENAKQRLLEEFPKAVVLTYAINLAADDAADAVYGWAIQHFGHVEVLVNCAGFGAFGFVNDTDMHCEAEMIKVNVLALHQLTRFFLADMLERDEGHIINMASIAAYQPNPFLATYGATKSFVLNFSQAIEYELRERRSRVRITVVCPTATTRTGFSAKAGMDGLNTFQNWMTVTPELVARDTYNGFKQGKPVVIPNIIFRLAHILVKRLPVAWLMRWARSNVKIID